MERLRVALSLGSPRVAVAGALALVAFAVAGTTVYAGGLLPVSNGVLSACENVKTGALRIIDPTAVPTVDEGGRRQTCREHERLLQWRQAGPAGIAGAQGPAGATGVTGTAGPAGAMGLAGTQGVSGAPGWPGPTGPTGAQGRDGATGATGADGSPGVPGVSGPGGAAGVAGSAGAQGPAGAVGPVGAAGVAGFAGGAGATGALGATGARGSMGAQGLGMPDIWGSHGTAQGEFDSPAAVATDGQYVYVADTGNHRVVKFTTNGIFVLQWIYPGQLNGIAVDLAGGVVYVSDSAFHVIQQFSASGASGPRLGTYGSSGSLDGQFNSPTGIATDALGNLYVADTGNQRIQKFDKWGTFLAKWGTSGNADGSLCDPNGIATYAGHVFVSDSCNDRIQEFDASGIFVAKWGAAGGGDGQLISPTGIAVAAGNVYVVDSGNQRIQEFSATTHSFVTSWGSPVSRAGTGYGEFANPRGVATSSAYVGSAGWVYIADTGNHRIHKVKF